MFNRNYLLSLPFPLLAGILMRDGLTTATGAFAYINTGAGIALLCFGIYLGRKSESKNTFNVVSQLFKNNIKIPIFKPYSSKAFRCQYYHNLI